MYTVLLVLHCIFVVLLIGLVLVQRSDSDGLSGLGGGGGNNQFMSGRSSANFMTRSTAVLAGLFMFTSLVLAIYASKISGHSLVDQVTSETVPAPVPMPKEEPATTSKDAPKEAPKKTPTSVPKPE